MTLVVLRHCPKTKARRARQLVSVIASEGTTMNEARDDIELFPALPEPPANIARRSFLMRNAAIGAAAVMTGASWSPEARAQQAAKEATAPKLGASLSPDLDVVKKSKGPVMTVVDEFY